MPNWKTLNNENPAVKETLPERPVDYLENEGQVDENNVKKKDP